MLSFADVGRLAIETRTRDGSRRITAAIDGESLFNGLQIGSTVSALIADLSDSDRPAHQAPIFCAVRFRDGWHVYSRVHQQVDRWCFIRTSVVAIPASGDDLIWLDTAVELHARHASILNSHVCTKPATFVGKEVETKFTLPARTSIWRLALLIHQGLTANKIPNMVPRFGSDFESYDFDNFLFEVTDPEEDRGYVSFMTVQPDLYRLKRKRFSVDARIRAEEVGGEFRPDRPLGAYVRGILSLEARRLPSFRRVRHDVMLESIVTGGHYCILFDRCSLHAAPQEVLVQCEIEYLRTRSVLPHDENQILEEFELLTAWVQGFLNEQGLAVDANYYSKLSYLRDVVQRRPELADETDHAFTT
ncbi:hypothetical protein [Micromonospora sp. NBC_01813]|uniref:hypothetical protein n=1 Tax=Micromonospora sp. NBC_01813 TaxID=2975988 RepID=UPI002DDA8106|nr:hypothetical protein [Micromonospora sp. NBC_01813]WSA06863.1 hypothetical protein OG958_21615 [Micromonospora sp. NBC_01813]